MFFNSGNSISFASYFVNNLLSVHEGTTSIIPYLLVIHVVVTALGIRLMQNRKAFCVWKILMVFNVTQIAISAFLLFTVNFLNQLIN